MKDPEKCLLSLEEAVIWRKELRCAGKRLVVTNGCFDLVHRGHASYLLEAAKLGDELLVLINSDASVKALKGDSRPIVSEADRAYLLAALESVSRVVIFNSSRCDRELAALQPDIYAKAGDYTIETLDAGERAALLDGNTEIVFMPFVSGFSTTNIVEKISSTLTK
ncbi:MAG: ADP-heptose synthase [Lentisphaerae bacterium]|nr:ADP-heptose synthase [Lentisphaerota bacterium]